MLYNHTDPYSSHITPTTPAGVDLILGCNGMLWVAPSASGTTSATRHTGMEVDGEEVGDWKQGSKGLVLVVKAVRWVLVRHGSWV